MLLVALPQQLLLPTVNQLWQGSWQFHFGTIWGASIKLLTPTGLQLIIQSRRANELIKFKHPAFWTQLKLKLECLGRNRSLLRGHRLKCFSSIETWYHEIHVANWFLVASIKLGSFTLAPAVFPRRKHLNVGIMEVDVVQLMLTTLLTEHELNLENFRKKWNFEQKKWSTVNHALSKPYAPSSTSTPTHPAATASWWYLYICSRCFDDGWGFLNFVVWVNYTNVKLDGTTLTNGLVGGLWR